MITKRRTGHKNGPHPVDIHVGHRVREQRTLLGMSQSALAERLGITFQQVQKYEKGTNRVSASRLHEIAKILNVTEGYFFRGVGNKPDSNSAAGDRETLEFVKVYQALPPAMRTAARRVIGAMGAA